MSNETPSDRLLRTSKSYALYVCGTRAIPNVEDGLKNGQRIALWLLRNRAEKLKTFALSGLMGYEKLYVHGEASANNAIGLLAAPYKNNVPLIEGLGQFGSRVDPVEGIGAPRYTEVRRSKIAELLLYRDLDLVPLKDNYDGSNKEPVHFLPLVPLVLLNGVEGVAVGWSTSILPRSLKALIQATQDALRGKKIKPLIPHYERYNIGVAALGPNQWEFTGRAEVVDTTTVHITELPPGIPVETFCKKLIDMEERDEITGFTDKSTEGIDIWVRFKRGSLKDWTDEKAISFLKLREKVTERITVIDWGYSTIKTYACAEDVVTAFAAWRLGWYTTRFEKMREDATYELIYWKLLRALFDAGFTKRLGTFADKAAVEADVGKVAAKAKLGADEKHVDRAVNLPTYRWTKAFEGDVVAKIADIEASIADYTAILGSPELLKEVYLSELEDLKKKV
jgi:DNA gyrase/topoisomerase IV subunit A